MKKSIKIILIILTVVVIAVIIIAKVHKSRIEKKEEYEYQLAHQVFVLELKDEEYRRVLCIHGHSVYLPDIVIVENMWRCEPETLANVMLYNEFTMGEKITVEQVLEEYDTFRYTGISGGLEQYKTLEAFYNQRFPDGVGYFGKKDTLDNNYIGYIYHYVNANFSPLYVTELTDEQMQEAAEYAIKRIRDDLDRGRY